MPLIFRSSIATIITIEGARLTTDYVGSASVSSALTFLLSGFQRHKIAANEGTNERTSESCMGWAAQIGIETEAQIGGGNEG